MPLKPEWINDHTVIYRVVNNFTLNDLTIINDEMMALFAETDRQYHVLLDGAQTKMLNFSPGDSIRNSPYLRDDHMASLIVFGTPGYLKAIAALVGMIIQTSTGTPVHFVATEAEALAIVRDIEQQA